MKITITSYNRTKQLVSFASKYGSSQAIWNGNDPEVNKEYFVEIEIKEILVYGKSFEKTTETNNRIEMHLGKTHIVGILESIEIDGYAVIRIGDSLIAVETIDVPIDLVGCHVVLTTSDSLFLYDVEY